jgi:prepilin signal peptidase PulO-like enzyme (type II secretory pathway)
MLIWNFVLYVLKREKRVLTKDERNIRNKKVKENIFSFLKEVLNLLVIFFVVVNFFGIVLDSSAGKNLSYFFTTVLNLEKWTLFIIILAAFIFLMRFLQKIKKVFYWAAIILLIWLFYKWFVFSQSPLSAIKPMLGTTAIIIFGGFIFRKMFDWYVNKKEIREIRIEELEAGMRLTDETINDLKAGDKKLFEKSIGNIYSDGLTKAQVVSLKKIIEGGKALKLKVYKSSPFAIWMFIGLIVTIVFRGSVIQPFLK